MVEWATGVPNRLERRKARTRADLIRVLDNAAVVSSPAWLSPFPGADWIRRVRQNWSGGRGRLRGGSR